MSEGIQFHALTHQESEWLGAMRGVAVDFVARYGAQTTSDHLSLVELDRAYEGWLTKTTSKLRLRRQMDPADVIEAVGVAVGDLVSVETGMRWCIITDSIGTDIGLHTSGTGKYRDVVTHPTSFVAKRVLDRQSGWLIPSVQSLVESLLHMRDAPVE